LSAIRRGRTQKKILALLDEKARALTKEDQKTGLAYFGVAELMKELGTTRWQTQNSVNRLYARGRIRRFPMFEGRDRHRAYGSVLLPEITAEQVEKLGRILANQLPVIA
jgi:hypothetical protein